MRLFYIAIVVGLFSSTAVQAQRADVEEILPKNVIELSVGESKTFRFPDAVREAKVVSAGYVDVTPLNDRQLSLTGTKAGVTQMFVTDPQGREIYNATVVVGQEPGRIVRLYDSRSKDYTGYYCTDTFCGRADKELNGARDVSSTTTTLPNGVSVTRTYGGASGGGGGGAASK